jgi:cobyrinic acid a,c-diamide synthase
MQDDSIDIPRILIAALRGGSGKTVLSIGIIAALCNIGKSIVPFKKGPDYIDAGWLAMAAGRPCHNLDTFMADEQVVCQSFLSHTAKSENLIAVIEGNRGLYDGLDVDGTTSTASLSKLLNTPVVLCLDCTKSTRTMAAVVLGLLHFDPDVKIEGIILNRVAGPRHENVLRSSIETHCGISVIGAVPKLKSQDFPERHMGLLPTPEHAWARKSIQTAADVVKAHVDLPAILRIAEAAENKPVTCGLNEPVFEISNNRSESGTVSIAPLPRQPKIGIIKDSAFQFYYPENLAALTSAGAELVFMSALRDKTLPEIDALYIGGGFPETHAEQLADNLSFKNSIKKAADRGLPVYAECGGLMYLGESLVLDKPYAMAGVLPLVFGFSKKPQGHGYTIATVDKKNPFYDIGTVLKGHEFHYSRVIEWRGEERDMAFSMTKGRGIIDQRDGICYKNVLATYVHIHAMGTPHWAKSIIRIASESKILSTSIKK